MFEPMFAETQPTAEPLRPLAQLPPEINEVLQRIDPILAPLEAKPLFSATPDQTNFKEGLIQNARLLYTFETEILILLKELNGTNSSNTMRSLALGTICTDLGKAGDLLPTEDGYNPDNFIARLYRMRWIKEHAEYCGKSRTEIPLEEALIVMAAVAKKNHPKTPPDEIDKSFTLSDQDRALLASKNYQLSLSTPLSRAFTELHVKADDVLLKKLEIDLPERAYACGHHLPAGLNLIPAEIVEMYHLNGDQGADELFISYIANTAVIVVADKLQGYIHRSGQLPQDGLISTVKDITEGLESNFANHPLKKKIIEIYTKVFEFAIVNHLAEYYGQ